MNHVAILLDESGSMKSQEERVISGINEYINTLKKDIGKAKCEITIRMFDSNHYRTHYTGSLKKLEELTVGDYKPFGMTPLFDSVGKTICEMQAKKGDKVVIIIDTDGMENCSVEFEQKQVKDLIKKKEDLGWAFIFMATGIDAMNAHQTMQSGAALGIGAKNSKVVTHLMRSAEYGANALSTSAYFKGDKDNKTLLDK